MAETFHALPLRFEVNARPEANPMPDCSNVLVYPPEKGLVPLGHFAVIDTVCARETVFDALLVTSVGSRFSQ